MIPGAMTSLMPGRTIALRLDMEGANNSTTFVDEGHFTHTMTAGGNAKLSTAQAYSGGSSLLLDGSGDSVSCPSHVGFNFGTSGFFRIRFAMRISTLPGAGQYPTLISRGNHTTFPGTQWGLALNQNGGGLNFNVSNGVNNWLNCGPNYTGSLSANTWYMVELARENLTASGIKLYLNESLVASSTSNPNLETNSSGQSINVGSSGLGVNGYIDQLEISF